MGNLDEDREEWRGRYNPAQIIYPTTLAERAEGAFKKLVEGLEGLKK